MYQNPYGSTKKRFKLELSDRQFWDLTLSNEVDCYKCEGVTEQNLFGDFDFFTTAGTCNNRIWEDAISFDKNLCDIGLTGYDNRFVDDFTGHVYNPSGDTLFCAYSVSGDVFCYNYSYQSGDVYQYQNELKKEPEHVQFCGGFFQGFYKLEGYDYETLPNVYPKGWTKEFWIKPNECGTGDTCTVINTGGVIESQMMLNDYFPDNKGIFYFKGIRAENKFCNPYSSPLNWKTCKGIPLFPDFEVNENRTNGEHPFLYYNRQNVCRTPEIYGEFEDCCDGLINNAMGFRYTDEGEVGIRILTTTGECLTHTGSVVYEDTPIMEEYYTDTGVVEDNVWNHVVFKYKPYNSERCLVKTNDLGILYIYINGNLQLQLDNFTDFVPYSHDEHKDKQLAVPYNQSFGGGTQGLLEAGMLNLTGETYYYTGDTVCDYLIYILDCDIINGAIVEGQEILLEQPIQYGDWDLLTAFLETIITQRNGSIEVGTGYAFLKPRGVINIKSSFQEIEGILTNNGLRGVCVQKCMNLKPHLGRCGYLEDNFAGTFEGGMAKVRMYDRPLCYHEIKCNYETEKKLYLRRDIKYCKKSKK